jgi:hypothetical protein
MVAIGCDVTAMTQTTGVAVCYSVDADADQGEDGVPRTFSPSTVTSPAVKTTTAGAGGGGESTSTKTTTNTAPSGPRASSIGQFDIAAFWETIIDPFPSKITGYYLNWIPATQTKIDPCGTAYLQDFGGVSPTSTTWSAMPNSISFDATYRVGDGTYSDCFYNNPAAPSSAGDGGTVSCRGGEVPCTTFNKWDVASCDGLDSETRVLPMIGCPITEVATMTT